LVVRLRTGRGPDPALPIGKDSEDDAPAMRVEAARPCMARAQEAPGHFGPRDEMGDAARDRKRRMRRAPPA
jgi:hypothetical protein